MDQWMSITLETGAVGVTGEAWLDEVSDNMLNVIEMATLNALPFHLGNHVVRIKRVNVRHDEITPASWTISGASVPGASRRRASIEFEVIS